MADRMAGCYFGYPTGYPTWTQPRYLPQIKLEAQVSIISYVSRATLTQTFLNGPSQRDEVRYSFPLYDGVSVVGFTCTIGDRIIRGVVKEKQKAREVYDEAVSRGETAGLLEQSPVSSDVFTTTIGNIPANAEIRVNITYVGELKHDAQVDGIRLTIPWCIAPRYGYLTGGLPEHCYVPSNGGIKITIDAEVPPDSHITSIESPSHQLAVTLGRTSMAPNAEQSFQKASATLALGTAELDKDFILQVKTTSTSNPIAILERHSFIPNQRALMATLVPKFTLPAEKPEIVFVCDRSGSMGTGNKLPNLQAALRLFVKSLSVGTKFNICSFGSKFTFLWKRSRTYDQTSVDDAMRHIETFLANYGGTEMFKPVEESFKRRYTDMNLEVFLLTDGQINDQAQLMTMINDNVTASNGAIRLFTLGIGASASHSLIEGVARAGNGFSQSVGDSEEMGSKIIRMLKGATFPHIKDYTLEVKYAQTQSTDDGDTDDDFEMVDKVFDGRLKFDYPYPPSSQSTVTDETPKAAISLFDPSIDLDEEMKKANKDADDRYSHLPALKPPEILQSPFAIPSLFPFNRTSVFLLMSTDAPQQTPKSVILRGTSFHGPLELEIPITILEQTGETIHQLAAKKAVGELEEGRGWIYHATDSEGQLLKDKYDGRFQDMVEREAVRLGVQYQIGGKWCSFVVVDSDGDTKVQDAFSRLEMEGGRGMNSVDFNYSAFNWDYARSMGRKSSSRPLRKAGKGIMGSFTSAARSVMPARILQTRSGQMMPTEPSSDLPIHPPVVDLDVAPTLPSDKLQALIVLYRFEGFWACDDRLLKLMGWDNVQVRKWWNLTTATPSGPDQDNIAATACVVAWLYKEKMSEKDTWDLLVDKAIVWLLSEMRKIGSDADEILDAAKEII